MFTALYKGHLCSRIAYYWFLKLRNHSTTWFQGILANDVLGCSYSKKKNLISPESIILRNGPVKALPCSRRLLFVQPINPTQTGNLTKVRQLSPKRKNLYESKNRPRLELPWQEVLNAVLDAGTRLNKGIGSSGGLIFSTLLLTSGSWKGSQSYQAARVFS